MLAWRQSGDALTKGDGTHRKATGNALGHGEDVRLDPDGLAGKERPGASKPGLDFIQNEQRTTFAAKLLRPVQKCGRPRTHTAFTLDDFQDDRADLIRDGGIEGGFIVVGDIGETGEQRLERLTVLWFPRGRQRPGRPPVEAPLGGNHAVAAGGQPGKLEGSFIGFRPGVAEKHARQSVRQDRRQLGIELGALVIAE